MGNGHHQADGEAQKRPDWSHSGPKLRRNSSIDSSAGDDSMGQDDAKGNPAMIAYFKTRCAEEAAQLTRDLPWIQQARTESINFSVASWQRDPRYRKRKTLTVTEDAALEITDQSQLEKEVR